MPKSPPAAGAAAAVAASAVPGGSIAASGTPISGITARAEAYATPDAAAETGRAAVVKECMAAAGYDFAPAVNTHRVDFHRNIGTKRLDVATAKASGYASLQPAGPREPAEGTDDAKLFADPAFVLAFSGPQTEENMVTVTAWALPSVAAAGRLPGRSTAAWKTRSWPRALP